MRLKPSTRVHRGGLGAMLLALWLVWMTNIPPLALWALFLAGLLVYILPAEVGP